MTPAMTERAALPVQRNRTCGVIDRPVRSTTGCARPVGAQRQPGVDVVGTYWMWMPETALAMMSRWISEVPSKMV